MMNRTVWIAAALGVCGLSGCADISPPDTINPTVVKGQSPVAPTAGALYWRLPKTVLDVTATFKLTSCKKDTSTNKLTVTLGRTIAIATRGVPDDKLYGEDAPDPYIRVPVSSTISFWQDRSLTVHHNSDGTLSQIGAVSEDQSAAVVGNVITSIAKLVSITAGVAPAGVGAARLPQIDCDTTTVPSAKAEQDRLNGLLKNPKTTIAEAAAYTLALQDQQKILDKQTITVTVTIDPGRTPLTPKGKPGTQVQSSGLVAKILPTAEQLKGANWLTGDPDTQLKAIENDSQLDLYLLFEKASPAILERCPPNSAGAAQITCDHFFTYIDRQTQFREPAMIPLLVRSGSTADGEIIPLVINGGKDAPPIAFAQFGIPRALPIKVGLFQKLTWTFNFNTLGEPQDVAFGSSAIGMKATSLLQSASTGAASVATEQRNANAAVSPEAARLQAQALELKAQVDVANYQDQVNSLKAEGKIPQ